MELVGERWAILIIRELMLGGRRFSDIRASLPGISAKVLTERLERLEALGIVLRRKLPPPAASQVYDLTEWGRGLEDVMQALGRWAVRSPLHNPMLPLTPVAFMLSLRTMFDPALAEGLACTIGFEVGDARFHGLLEDGELTIEEDDRDGRAPDLFFRAETANAFLPVFYGKRPLTDPDITLLAEGDPALVERFIGIFSLPEKCAVGEIPDN
ncbi:MAG: transcriptional regulator [Novosphingobium sp.]|nr:transcriptional regulator [Novosphingobium sp.]